MARYPVVSTSTIVLSNPTAGRLLSARTALGDAEADFYRDRRDLVNSYPMKRSDITRSEIESLYDTHLGTEPWRYRRRFNDSGSRLKTGTYGNSSTFSGSHDEFYVEPWGTTPTGEYPNQLTGAGFSTSATPFLYDEERGAPWVDLIVKYGYTRGFSSQGSSRTASVTTGAGDGAITRYFPVYEGFGREPVAYEGRGGLSNFEAHMLKLVGDAWEDTVGSAYSEYRDALDAYQSSVGSPVGISFTPTGGTGAWSGFTGTAGGSNRPQELPPGLVSETRGAS